mmetsp:Transcript_3665/g.5416  ORF Transcript_3665/g.5416 Transcript_3665/m.5416 type:complete len:311 (+) Transcript_3665:106-1038(+)
MVCKKNTGFSVKLEKDLAKKIIQIEDVYIRKYKTKETEKRGKNQRYISTEFDIDISNDIIKKKKKKIKNEKKEEGSNQQQQISKMTLPLKIEINQTETKSNSTNTVKTDDDNNEEIYDDVLLSYDLDSEMSMTAEELQLGSEDFITPPTSIDSKAVFKSGVGKKKETPPKKNNSKKNEKNNQGSTDISIFILTKEYDVIYRNTPKEKYLKTEADVNQFTNQLKDLTRISHAFCDNSFGEKWTEPVQTIFLTGNRFTMSSYIMPDLILSVIVPLNIEFNAHHFKNDIQPIILDLQLMMRGVMTIQQNRKIK